MNRRILVPLALLTGATLALTACGGKSEEDKIVEVIDQVMTTADPDNCTELQTLRFNEQNNQVHGKAATEACEERAKDGKAEAEGAKVSNVTVDGEEATAEIRLEGGPLGSQTLEVAVVQEDGDWKLHQVVGFASYDGKALGKRFGKELEQKEVSPEQAKCITRKIAGLGKAEAEELFFSGSPEPIVELAQGCA